jgi:hypothetical protein
MSSVFCAVLSSDCVEGNADAGNSHYGAGDVRVEAVPGSSERQALKVLIQP